MCYPAAPRPISHAPFPTVRILFQLIQMFEPRQNYLLARLLDLAGQEDLVQDCVDLVEVEDQVQLAYVAEEGVEDLDEEVDGLEVGQLVVVGVDAGAEEQARVPSVDNLVVAELDKVGLVFLVAGGDEAVDLHERGGREGEKWSAKELLAGRREEGAVC